MEVKLSSGDSVGIIFNSKILAIFSHKMNGGSDSTKVINSCFNKVITIIYLPGARARKPNVLFSKIYHYFTREHYFYANFTFGQLKDDPNFRLNFRKLFTQTHVLFRRILHDFHVS